MGKRISPRREDEFRSRLLERNYQLLWGDWRVAAVRERNGRGFRNERERATRRRLRTDEMMLVTVEAMVEPKPI